LHVTYFLAASGLFGGCLLGGEGIKIGVSVWRMAFGRRARGTMVSHQERLTRNGNHYSPLFPVIEFVAANGETVTFTDAVTARKWAIGRECAVGYDPTDPAGTAVAIRPNSIAGLLICVVFSLASFAGTFWLLSGGFHNQ
jgi:hypothetical protein